MKGAGTKGMFDILSTSVLVICALIVTGLVLRREFFRPPQEAPAAKRIVGAEAALWGGQPMGPKGAPISIVVFSDFQCPFCAKLTQNLKVVRDKYPNEFGVVYRHLPIESIHPESFNAALAAECAGAQGRFESYHDALFSEQDSIGKVQWSHYARIAGVPSIATFEDCIKERAFDNRIRTDMKLAKSFGLTGTPSVIVGDTLLPGTPSARVLDSILTSRLHGSSQDSNDFRK